MRSFGERRAVDGVGLELREGESLAIVGPNGAGKSTLLRMIATLLRPDAGELRVAGHPLPERASRVRGLIGYLTHDPLVYLDLTAWQNLELFADLYGVPRPRERIEELLDRVDLLSRSFEPVRTFSRGMAQRLGVARLLLHRPSLLLLDEPYGGLDAPGAAFLDQAIADARGAQAVVLVTHDMERARRMDRVLTLENGKRASEDPSWGRTADDETGR